MAKVKTNSQTNRQKLRPALMPENRVAQLTAMAMDLAEQQMRDGTASSQVISYFLKAGSEKEKLEIERLAAENEVLRAKAKQLEDMADMKVIYENAIKAMRNYSGNGDPDEYED